MKNLTLLALSSIVLTSTGFAQTLACPNAVTVVNSLPDTSITISLPAESRQAGPGGKGMNNTPISKTCSFGGGTRAFLSQANAFLAHIIQSIQQPGRHQSSPLIIQPTLSTSVIY
jgi:hypothetical protein